MLEDDYKWTDRPGAILKLALALRSLAPPKLSLLIVHLDSVDDIKDFVSIVEEYLPESAQEIITAGSPSAQVGLFFNRFGSRYFPLDEVYLEWAEREAECYQAVTSGIPVQNLSFDIDNDYHEIPAYYGNATILMTLLIESPYVDSDDDRVALAESAAEIVPVELVQRVPDNGFSREKLNEWLKDTPYQAVATWANRMAWDTGNFFFDMETLRRGCGYGHIPLPEWDHEVIADLVSQWQEVDRLMDEFVRFRDWLEEAPAERFKEVLDFILGKERIDARENGDGEDGSEWEGPRVPAEVAETPGQRTLGPG